MGNKDAIEYALKVLYSKELNPESENISGETSDLSEADMEYALAVVEEYQSHPELIDHMIESHLINWSMNLAVVEEYQSHPELIDHMIESHLINWSMKQLNVVDKNILRTAIAEYLKFGAPDKRNMIINQAVELAKIYGGENSYRFINGLLDQALKEK